MSTSTRLPRKAKRQKRGEVDTAMIGREKEFGNMPSTSFESWRVKAKEALDYRDESMDGIVPPLPDIKSIPEYCLHIPDIFLDKQEKAITTWNPEQIVRSIFNGDIDSRTVTNAFLRRAGIAAKLTNCVTELLPLRALNRARVLDEHLTSNPETPVGPLHGLPISIKGSIAFKDLRMHSGWISWWDKDRPESDALVIEILENAGAVFQARTTAPQGMMQLETQSNLFGITTNPYNSKLSAGGSSGGEASLICLGGSTLGVGSDIGGSIRVPAAACGVYGFKPTAFRIPANGWNCVAPSADTIPTVIGPISVSLSGVDMFMSAVLAAKPWIKDPCLSSMPWQSTSIIPTAEEPLCIGILWHDDEVLPHPPITRAIEGLVARVRANPALSKRVKFYDFPAHRHSYGWDLLSKLYFSDGGASDRAAAAESGEPLCPLLEWLIDEHGVKRLTRSQLELALEDREAFREEYAHHWNAVGAGEEKGSEEHESTLSAFKPYSCKVNVLICPVAPYIASPHGKAKYWSYTSLWNLLDYPALSLPTLTVVSKEEYHKPDRKGFMSSMDEEMWSWYDPELYDKMPVSIQLVGRRNEDEKVLAIARFLEENHITGPPNDKTFQLKE